MPPASRSPAGRRDRSAPPTRSSDSADRRPRRPPPRSPRDPGGGGRDGRGGRQGGQRRRGRSGSDLLARVLVALPLIVLAIVFVDVGGTAWAVLMIVFGATCTFELYGILARWRPVQVVGLAAVAAMVLAARFGTQSDVLEIAVATIPVTFLFVLGRGPGGLPTVAIAGTLLGVFWIGLAFAHAELLRQLPNGKGIMLDLLIGTFLGDTGAYVGGRLFGRRPLAPSISPNKTFEGLICGVLIAILSVFIAGLNQTFLTHGDALLLGVTIAVLGPVGDLFESMVKRDSGAKDAGRVFGAHGGALDRFDAVIFTVVAGYYVWLGLLH